jgi:hypothetical protein
VRRLAFLALAVLGSAGWAQVPRLAVHPLELRELSPEQREKFQALFDVLLARVPDIRLAGTSRVEDALARPEGKGCESHDACLRFLAESTESLYGVFARVRADPLGAQLTVVSRVVRSDGALVRKVSLAVPIEKDADLTESGRQLLGKLLSALDLGQLRDTLPVVTAPANAPASFDRPEPGLSARRATGFGLVGVGGATLVAGGVLAALAASGRASLTPDKSGAVPPSEVERAANVVRQSEAASVLIPIGAVLVVGGAALALWPTERALRISVGAGPEGAALMLGGRLP